MTESRISTLRLAQFRSYGQARLELNGCPAVLFGPNGSGKTNILEAVSMFSPGRGMRRARPEEISCRQFGTGWKAEAELVTGGRELQVATYYRGGAGRRVEIEGKSARQADLGKLVRILWVSPAMDRLWADGRENRRRFLDRMVMSFFPSHTDDVIAYEKAMRERNRLLKERRFDDDWLGGLESQMAVRGVAMTRGRMRTVERLEISGKQACGTFPRARLSLTAPDEAFGNTTDPEELSAALKSSRVRDAAAGRTLVGPHRADLGAVNESRNMEARGCSTGEQKALLLSIVLANVRAISQECGWSPILLLDEVTAHLDADCRGALFAEIRKLELHAWLTGTQADLFDAMGSATQWFEVSETNGESTVRECRP